MNISELKPAPGSRHKQTRVGRGIGSGLGKTSGRGHKGQKARSGGGVRRGFEGGQMPLLRRVPKRGFTNVFKKEFATVNIQDLNRFADGTVVSPGFLIEQGVIAKGKDGLKILGRGTLEKSLTVHAHAFSATAREKITNAGGKAEVM